MKIAFLNRDPGMYPGGDVLSLRNLAVALGEECIGSYTIFDKTVGSPLDSYDLIVIKHMNFGWSEANFDWALRFNKPIVLQPMFYPGRWGVTIEDMQDMVNNSVAIMPYAPSEWAEMQKAIFVEHLNVFYIPNGVGKEFIVDTLDPDRQGHVLTSRARDDAPDVVKKVCKGLGIPHEHTTGIKPEEMCYEYEKARVYVHVSDPHIGERMSRAIQEALVGGCRVVCTEKNHGNYWYETLGVPKSLFTFNPHEELDIKCAIERAWFDTNWNFRPNIVARQLTWGNSARMFIDMLDTLGLWIK